MSISSLVRPKASTPWKRTHKNTKIKVAIASVVPLVITAISILQFRIPGFLAVIAILLPIQLIAAAIVGASVKGRHGRSDAILMVFMVFFSVIVFILLGSVLWSVIEQGLKVLSWSFISQNNNYITPTTSLEYGGLGHALLGSIEVVLVSTVITVPLGVLVGVYLTETRDKSRSMVRSFVQSLAGLPSVVAGLFIYSSLILTRALAPTGLTGSLALIPLMLPTVARVCEESLKLVPQDLRNAAIGLGASRFKAFIQVTMPAAKSGIITAILLGVARIFGETAPILLTTVLATGTNLNIFNGPIATLPNYLYSNLSSSNAISFSRAWGTALVMLIFVAISFTSIRVVSRNKTVKIKKRK
jgi:phosphate transport system permease protein